MADEETAPSAIGDNGVVLISGAGVAFTLTPDDASDFADRLIAAAMVARQQRKKRASISR